MLNKHLYDEISYLRSQVRGLQERCDRLTEALAAKSGVQVEMPYTPPINEPSSLPLPTVHHLPATPSDAEVLAARSRSIDGWWQAMVAGTKIATPVVEKKVPAPQ